MISESGCDFAVYNWLSDEHNEAYVPVTVEIEGKISYSEFYAYSHHIDYYSTSQLICSGGVHFYRNSMESRELLKRWQEVVAQNPYCADDECLDFAYNNLDRSLEFHSFWLDKSYLRLPWWPHIKPVILHPGMPAAGVNRNPLTGKDGKQRFYPEGCQKKQFPLFFPPDCVIDTERCLLLKIENSEVVEVKSIMSEFWIYPEDMELPGKSSND